MKLQERTTCSDCERSAKRLEKLEARIAELEKQNAQLQEQLAKACKNSSTSSKPPSSDIVKPPNKPAKGRKKRKRGGQFGHKKHGRKLFAPEQIDKTIIHKLPDEEVQRRNLTPLNETESALQQVDLPEKLYNVIEHRVQLYVDLNGNIIKAKLPKEIRKEGFFTSSMTAFVGYLKARCHMSYSTTQSKSSMVLGTSCQGY